MKRLSGLVLVFMCIGCEHRGGVDELCLVDGTCISELKCTLVGWQHLCRLVPPPPTTLRPARCNYESECFCTTCADHCQNGVKTCSYSDTSVWGAKPSLCECQ